MSEELRKQFNIPAEHTIVHKETKCEQRKGQDTDIYFYDEIDPQGNVVGNYIERDSTSIYPPFGRNVSYKKV